MRPPRRSRAWPARCRRAARRGSNGCADFGASFGGTLICLCSRIALADNSPAVLVVSTERAGKDLSLPDRAQRLLADLERPAAIFTADGELIEAVPAARERFGDKRDLIALGAEQARPRGIAQRPRRRRHRGLARHHAPPRRRRDGDAARRIRRAREGGRRRDGRGCCASGAHRPQSGRAGTASAPLSVPLRLADGCGDPLHPRHGRFRQAARPEDRRRARPPVGGDRRRAQARSARPGGERAGRARHLERHRRALAGRRCGSALADRDVGPAGVRPRPPVCRLSRLRHLPRRRSPGRAGAAPGASGPAAARRPSRSARGQCACAFPPPAEEPPALSPGERSAFQELARELSDRLKKTAGKSDAAPAPDDFGREPAHVTPPSACAAGRAQRRCRPRYP